MRRWGDEEMGRWADGELVGEMPAAGGGPGPAEEVPEFLGLGK
jgi:hypothetical protein